MLTLYADGGVLDKNPSTRGGTWAWYLSPLVKDYGIEYGPTTNNKMEFYAILLGLEALAAFNTEAIVVKTDSQVAVSWWKDPTYKRQTRKGKHVGPASFLPEEWVVRAVRILGIFDSLQVEHAPRNSTPELVWCDTTPKKAKERGQT